MRPAADELLHFSDRSDIEIFHPRVAPTSREPDPYVWAVDEFHSPSYLFPRQCPRAMAWRTSESAESDVRALLGPGADRVHVIEYGWLTAMQTAELYAYRLPRAQFRPLSPDETHAYVASVSVTPLGPAERVGDLLALHRAAGIQLRLVERLWPWWDAVAASSLGFGGIRLRNAIGHPPGDGVGLSGGE